MVADLVQLIWRIAPSLSARTRLPNLRSRAEARRSGVRFKVSVA